MSAIALISAERERQIEREGYTWDHDDRHDRGELARAAACYAMHSAGIAFSPFLWPWLPADGFKPSDDPIRDLVRAGALIVAEIERLQRARGLSQ